MKTGFYELQEAYAGDMRGFLDALDRIEAELPVNVSPDPGVFEPALVGVGSFMQGYCGHLALRMADAYGLGICAIQTEGEMTHVFNTFLSPSGTLCYLDARGVTDDVELFAEPFANDNYSFLGPMTRQEAVNRMNSEGWSYVEDDISNAMVDWLISRFGKNFEPAIKQFDPLKRKPSLDDLMTSASVQIKQRTEQGIGALDKQISLLDVER